MSSTPLHLHPLTFEPILRRLLWGGRRLGTELGKAIGVHADYAESWEISDYNDLVSRVNRGPLAGVSLRDLVRTRGAELFGPGMTPSDQFPLLVKFLDARQTLSVQVHPDDERGLRLVGDNGKTEAWVIMAADPGSRIYAGLRDGVGPDELLQAVRTSDVEPILHAIEARPGDCFLIEAGTVHAIGAGVLLAEIQQMSDATFRVFDWDRVGPDGSPRELHLDEALESIDFSRGPVAPVVARREPMGAGNTLERLASCRYFVLERLELASPAEVGTAERFTIVLGLEGRGTVEGGGESVPLGRGETVLLPASVGACRYVPEGKATILTCHVP